MPSVETVNKLDLPSLIDRCLPICRDNPTLTTSDGSSSWTITIETPSSIGKGDLEACFHLIESTSKAGYLNSSMGWHPRQKKKEMKLPDMRYLLVRELESDLPVGFVSFMMTYEDGIEVVYVYEIHLSNSLRGHGFGKRLMRIVEEAGKKAKMKKAMLTVFLENSAANSFYKALGYGVDEFSPEPRRLRGGVMKEPDYNILSKTL